jgi:hypothetical protein
MAGGINRWTGNALNVKQVDTFTPSQPDIGDIYTLTVTGLDGSTTQISFTATAATVANVTAGLVAAWNASTNALCTPVTAADITTALTLTADEAGIAFSVSGSATGGETLTRDATTANAGCHDVANADNWTAGAPEAGDTLYFEDSSVNLLYGLDQSAIALTAAYIGKSFTGQIGVNGASGVAADYLKLNTPILRVGYNSGFSSLSGSGRIKIDLGSTACAVDIDDTGSAIDTGKPALRLKANSASTTIKVKKGSVGIAFESGETSTISSADVASGTTLIVGTGLTVTTLKGTVVHR